MIKTIFKELIITLLLCIAIVLILGVVFYNYNPINKIVPSKIDKYATSENVKEEINVNILELETTNVLYRVEATDLNMYIKNKTYVQGKANPFETISAGANGNTNTENGGSTGNNNTGSSDGQTTNNGTSSDGTFWNSTKTK